MTPEEQKRLAFLSQGPCAPPTYIKDFYGLDWPLCGEANEDFARWREKFRRPTGCSEVEPSRFELEMFLQQQRVLSKKWMAVRLGMQIDSLEEILPRLPDLGLRTQRYVVYPEFISDSLLDDLVTHLSGLKFRTFGTNNSFCERLHAELSDSLGIEIQPLFCETSIQLNDDPLWFANTFDCITLKPLSTRHQIWLDFGKKPLALAPDRCSKLFYVENRADLKSYCAGTREPEGLELYGSLHAENIQG